MPQSQLLFLQVLTLEEQRQLLPDLWLQLHALQHVPRRVEMDVFEFLRKKGK